MDEFLTLEGLRSDLGTQSGGDERRAPRKSRQPPKQQIARRFEIVVGSESPTGFMDTFNYFNYFTEIEEYFWRKRGAHLLVSPLDWAILETWQKAEIPVKSWCKKESIARLRAGNGRGGRRAGGR